MPGSSMVRQIMKLDAGVLTAPCRDSAIVNTGIATSQMTSHVNPTMTQYIPSKVADVPRETLKTFPHTKRVGNYLLGRTLGEGSFAKVKEGLHILTGERVAIKVIDKKKAKEDAYVRKNMRREGKLLQQVRHRNVIRLYEVMETENSYYLVTELCRGGDLMDHICNRKRLDEREARKYIRQIVSAVDYLHKAGILHRDLKVENLLLDENRNIKIIDFGLSNSVRVAHTREGGSVVQEYCVTQCGSPAYAAPELLGNKKYGPQVDVWSIGVNMFAMLTGNLPFTVEPFNIKTLHNKMLNGDMNAVPDHLSKHCKDILRKFLTADPEQRISLTEAFSHQWITDGKNRPMESAQFPNKLSADELDHDIVRHMSQNLEYRLSEVIRLVTSNIPSSATATYHLLARKLNRYNAEMRVQGKVAAAETQLLSVSRSTQNTSGYISPADVIDLVPLSEAGREKNSRLPDAPERKPHDRDEPKLIDRNLSPRRLPPGGGDGERRLVKRQVKNTRVIADRTGCYGNKAIEQTTTTNDAQQQSNSEGIHINTDIFNNNNNRPVARKEPNATEEVQMFKLPDTKRKGGTKEVVGTSHWTNGEVARIPADSLLRAATQDRRADGSQGLPNIPNDLPAIQEASGVPGKTEEDDGEVDNMSRPFKSPKQCKTSPIPTRQNVVREPKTNYAFRLRAQQNARSTGGDRTNNSSANPGISKYRTNKAAVPPTSSQSTTSSNGRRSTCSGPSGQPSRLRASPEQTGSVSDPATRRERRSARNSTSTGGGSGAAGAGAKHTPGRILIDVNHYERFARHGVGIGGPVVGANVGAASPRVGVGANGPGVSTNRTFPSMQDKCGVHTRRLVNLVYPTYNKPGGRVFTMTGPRPGVGATTDVHFSSGNRNKTVFVSPRDETLNITGEKTRVNDSKMSVLARSHPDASPFSPKLPAPTEILEVRMHNGAGQPTNEERSNNADSSSLREPRIALPSITPPPLNTYK